MAEWSNCQEERFDPQPFQLRESSVPYGGDFGPKNDDIAPENTYFWDVNL